MSFNAVFNQFPRLTTENLILRQLQPLDAPALLQIYSDPDVVQYLDTDPVTELERIYWIINRRAEFFRDRQKIRWGIARKMDNVIIGSIGFTQWYVSAARAEVGYDLAKSSWRKGIMTEALKAAIAFGFQVMECNRIEATVMVDNIASANLLRKLGFTEEGILRDYGCWRGRFHSLRMFSLLKQEAEIKNSVLRYE
jgi:ribosomal-protein-alanine N-acetyltransferase